MHKFLSLTRVTLKNTLGMTSDGTTKTRNTILLYLVLLVALIPMAVLLYMMFSNSFMILNQLDQAGSVLAVAFHLTAFVVFFFSIFLIPSVFYFSKDGETLLSLPLSPQAILGSKFVVCLLYEYMIAALILCPAFLAYAATFSVTFIQLLIAVLIFALLPIFPLVLSSLIAMLIMRFVPFFKNRDRFNLIAGILSVVLAFGLSFSLNSFSVNQDPNALLTTIMSGNNSLISLMGYCFPTVPFATRAFINTNMLSFLLFIGITALSLAICMMLGKVLYFKGLIGFSETTSSRKKLSAKDMGKLNQKKNRIVTYTMKELKLLCRAPIYLLNCIGASIIFPILIFLFPILEGDFFTTINITADIQSLLFDYWPYFIIAGIVLGIFVGNLNLISSTSISREGSNFPFMKYIPMPLQEQLNAKVASGVIVSIATDALMLIAIYVILPIFPISLLLLVFITSLVAIVFSNYLGICLDIYHPKLVWEQEAAAVKQNITSLTAMLGGMGVAILVGVVASFVPQNWIPMISIGILLLLAILSVIFYFTIGKFAKWSFDRY